MKLFGNHSVVSQGRCPHPGCGSSDAYTTYSDGGTWCFSCCAYTKGTGPIKPQIKREDVEICNIGDIGGLERIPVTLENCPDNYRWLKQYLNDEEIAKHFKYIPARRRHVFDHGTFTEMRSVREAYYPKTLTYGEVPLLTMNDPTVTVSETTVIVEDVVSAIKVGRQFVSVPLFGSYFPLRWMLAIGQSSSPGVVIWLDKDKWTESVKYQRTFSGINPNVFVVKTQQDPKALSDEEIKIEVCTAILKGTRNEVDG